MILINQALVIILTYLLRYIESSSSIFSPTVVEQQPFHLQDDAIELRKAMKGLGTNEDDIVSVSTKRSFGQRVQILQEYHRLHNRDLITDLKSELSGIAKVLLVGLYLKQEEFFAHEIDNAVAGLGTNEATLNDIFCCTADVKIEDIKLAYTRYFSKDMEKEVKSDVSGDYGKLLETLMTRKRRHGVEKAYVNNSVSSLIKAGASKILGTDESKIITIFSESSYDELKLIDQEYQKITRYPLMDAVRSETSGNLRQLLSQILNYAEDPVKYYARRINSALHDGLVKKDLRPLTRILVSRAEKDLGSIKSMYGTIYWTTLDKDVQTNTSKTYQRAALSLINGNKH